MSRKPLPACLLDAVLHPRLRVVDNVSDFPTTRERDALRDALRAMHAAFEADDNEAYLDAASVVIEIQRAARFRTRRPANAARRDS